MPELAEAEIVARQLRARIVGATLKDCWVGRPDIVRQGLATLDWYRGTSITKVERHGKSILLALSRAGETRYLVAELGMTGLLLFREPDPGYRKHTHLVLVLDGSRNSGIGTQDDSAGCICWTARAWSGSARSGLDATLSPSPGRASGKWSSGAEAE